MCVDRRPFLADPIEASRRTADRMVARCHRAVMVGKKRATYCCVIAWPSLAAPLLLSSRLPAAAALVDKLLLRPRPRLLAPAGSDSAEAGGGR
jgi:hypothetical protein